jgi:hypothetical protein
VHLRVEAGAAGELRQPVERHVDFTVPLLER